MLNLLIYKELSISLIDYFFYRNATQTYNFQKNDISLQPKSENSSFDGLITTSSLLKVFNDNENSFC